MGHLEAIWGPVREVGSEGHSGSILGLFWVESEVNPRKPHGIPENCLHLAVGRPFKAKYG